jgi:N,N'-diacetyllegionaminate synthase
MPYIIAEIGINFEGNIKKAIKLIKIAKRTGVNAVKFQVFKAETLAAEKSKKTSSQKKNTKENESLYRMWKRMELNAPKLSILKKISKKNKLDFICSVFDEDSLKKVNKLADTIKIASSEITDLDLITKISKTKKKIIMSTGMASFTEIKKALKILKKNNVSLLHCVSIYPCPDKLVNLNRMKNLKKLFNKKVGFSDHSLGNEACYAALSMGADIIEKHFTDNKNLKGADHAISADETDMKKIVNFSKKILNIKGLGAIVPSNTEIRMRKFFRKSLYYKYDLKKGSILNAISIYSRRPFAYICSSKKKKIIGKKINTNVNTNSAVKITDIN